MTSNFQELWWINITAKMRLLSRKWYSTDVMYLTMWIWLCQVNNRKSHGELVLHNINYMSHGLKNFMSLTIKSSCPMISGSILAQVMICCLRAPSHYLDQCWLQLVFCCIHLTAISQELLMNLQVKFHSSITFYGLASLGKFWNICSHQQNYCHSEVWMYNGNNFDYIPKGLLQDCADTLETPKLLVINVKHFS